ncbi:MAG TPA: hypothetical protein VFC63_23760 [Blastocatellia bacterium]|nr:hypothetical protein [Blastocatellia bacterium]
MKKIALTSSLVVFLTFIVAGSPQDQFTGIQCGSDITKTLIGRKIGNGSSEAIEKKHTDLGLKDLGGDEIADKLFSSSWRICGDEYMLLLDGRSIIRDTIKVPAHSKKSPESIGKCQANGTKIPGTVVAILNNEEGKDSLSATAAWKIDTKTAKFVKLSTDGLMCSRDGIITEDGGR